MAAPLAAVAAQILKYGPKVIQGIEMFNQTLGKTAQVLKFLYDPWMKIQDVAYKTGRTMAMNRDELKSYNESLIAATRSLGIAYGKTYEELAKFQEEYSQATGRNVKLTQDQLAYMSAMSNIMDPVDARQLVDEYDKMGVGIGRSLANVELIEERAKALGLNGTKAAKGLADNIKLASKYSFKNGVEDIQKMVLKSQHLRMNMDSVMRAADNFMDIENAIKTTANIQVLGGSFGAAFNNPMQAMYEAEADPAAFQERLVKMLDGKGKYDQKTGAVTFDPVTMRTIRAAADSLHVSVEELTNPAMAKVQDKEVEKEINRNVAVAKFSDEDKEAIMSLSRTNVDKDGKHFVTYMENGEVVQRNVEQLTKEQLDIAKANQLGEEQLWGDVHDIRDLMDKAMGRAQETKSMKEDIDGIGNSLGALWATAQNTIFTPISSAVNWFTELFGNGTKHAQGGIIRPTDAPLHAQFGAMVPGNSYMGDKVPALLNSGEMVLNQPQQKGMFDMLKSLADIGVNSWMMNMVGNKLGVPGLGKSALMANVMSGGNAGLMDVASMHLMNKIMSGGVAATGNNVAGDSADMFAGFSNEFSILKKEWSAVFGSIRKDITGGLSKFSASVVNTFKGWGDYLSNTRLGSAALTKGRRLGRKTSISARRFGRKASAAVKSRYTGSFLERGVNRTKDYYSDVRDTDYDYNIDRWRNSKTGRFKSSGNLKKGTKTLIKTKSYAKGLGRSTGKFFKAIPGLGKVASVANVASTAADIAGPATNVVSEAGSVAKSAGSASKVLGGAAKSGGALKGLAKMGGRSLGKALPGIGTALSIGMAIGDIASASSDYNDKVKEIEGSNMTDMEKARAKDSASKEKNSSIGAGIGSAAGAGIGMALGSALGPLGMVAGGAIGGWLGEKAGGLIGGMFGGGEEEKLKKEQEKKEQEQKEKEERQIKLKEGNNQEIIEILKDIRSKLSGGILGRGRSIGETAKGVFDSAKGKDKGVLGTVKKLSTYTPLGFIANKIFSSDSEGDGVMSKIKNVAKYTPAGFIANKIYGNDEEKEDSGFKEILEKFKAVAKHTPAGFVADKLFGGGNIANQVDIETGEVKESTASNVSVQPKEENNYQKVTPVSEPSSVSNTPTSVSFDNSSINLNVSGSIKLEGGGQTANIDLNKLIETPEFKRQLLDMMQRAMNESANGGRYNRESATNNGNSLYNKTGS